MFNGDGVGAITRNNDVINNNKRTAVVYATEVGELYTGESERKYLLGSFKSGDTKLVFGLTPLFGDRRGFMPPQLIKTK